MRDELFGRTADGDEVRRHTLARGAFRVRVIEFGAVITSIETPDRQGRSANVVLGLPDLRGYETVSPSFGAVVGRFANRIAGGRFTLDGTEYRLLTNDRGSTLHGGPGNFGLRLWQAREADETGLTLVRRSPNGEEGFPGNLDVEVRYGIPEEGVLRLTMRAFTDRPTPVNLTNHSYFNLAGEGSGDVLGHRLRLEADAFLPTDPAQLPTGEIRPVAGTPFDFRTERPIGEGIRTGDPQIVAGKGYDHAFVLRGAEEGRLRLAAACHEPVGGRRLEVWTTQPSLQLYTGNTLDGTLVGPSGRTYRAGDAVCFETQGYPDAPNHPNFPSAILRPGQVFEAVTEFRFSNP